MKCDITQEELKRLFSYDRETGLFTRLRTTSSRYKAGSVAGNLSSKSHQKIWHNRKQYYIHRLAWLYEYGYWPECFVDHINGDSSDNRIENLRESDHSKNGLNRGKTKNNKSGFKNVCWCQRKKAWGVNLRIRKQTIVVGFFDDVMKANEAAIKARAEYQGEYAIEWRASV